MGVYIKGMEMPDECTHCRFTYKYEHPEAGEYEICPFVDEPIPQAGIDNRCPLVEIKEPHGRLVDVNTAYQDTMIYGEKFRKSVLKIIDDLDTVIESEE